MDKQAVVYALIDPGTEKIRYVGSTTDDVGHRVRLHWINRYRKTSPVALWLQSLNDQPKYVVLNKVFVELRLNVEDYYIKVFSQSPGIELLNVRKAKKPPRNKRLTKLSEDDVRVIRESKESLRVLASKYDVSWITIRNVRLGLTWMHVKLHMVL
jgi:hypothetical protein